MMFRMLRAALSAVAILCVAPAGSAYACSCRSMGPPCEAAWAVDAVFVGVVRSVNVVERPAHADPDDVELWEDVLVRFDVERPFLNAAAGPVEIWTGRGLGDCGYTFAVGQRYLVYARKPKTRLIASICSRTRPLDEAKEDLEYLNAIPPGGNGARLYGVVKHVEHDPAGDVVVDYGPMEGLLIVVRGRGFAREARTDERGRYELMGIPYGKSVVAVFPPPEFDSRYLEDEIDIKDVRACVQRDFQIRYEARVTGTVLDSAGRLVEGITVEAVAAEHVSEPRRSQEFATTDAAGWFELRGLSPGAYAFGVNLTRPPEPETPFAPTYFPGTARAAEAVAIELKPGDQRHLGTFHVGDRLAQYALRGCVEWPENQSAPRGVRVAVDGCQTVPQASRICS